MKKSMKKTFELYCPKHGKQTQSITLGRYLGPICPQCFMNMINAQCEKLSDVPTPRRIVTPRIVRKIKVSKT